MKTRMNVDTGNPDWVAMVAIIAHYAESQELRSLTDELSVALSSTSYQNVSQDAFMERIRVNWRALVAGLRQRREPSEQDEDKDLRATGAARAQHGVTEADLARGALISQRLKMVRITERAISIGVPNTIIVEALQLLDAWLAFQTQSMLVGHRQAVLENSAEESRRRERSVRRLLEGGLSAVEVSEYAQECGLDGSKRYVVLCVPRPDNQTNDEMYRALRQAGLQLRPQTAFTYLYGSLYIVSPTLPQRHPELPAGISNFSAVPELAEASRLASRCADTALALKRYGFLGISDISVLSSLTTDEEVGDALYLKYIDPINALGRSGDAILDTVAEYLEQKRNVNATAKVLFVHSNTVRYRVSRFEELTRSSLREVRAAVEVWWTMHLRSLRRA